MNAQPSTPIPAAPGRDAGFKGIEPAGGDSARIVWIAAWVGVAYVWFTLINNVRLEWGTNPQYGYGWLVPVFCAGLAFRRWMTLGAARPGENPSESGATIARWVFAALAFCYFPTRLIEGSTPEWRPIQWALGVEAIGLTLCMIYLARGKSWLRKMAFPLCFFLVAIPWPSVFEIPIIQGLTRASAAIVINLLGILGVPAIQHGNSIEVGTGMVFIDEACSGIRSFQSSIMISLFLGEFYRMRTSRRALIFLSGFVLSMGFNVCRMFILTWIAAKNGVDAIEKYHDPAGVSILVACTAAMWGLALLLSRKKDPDDDANPAKSSNVSSSPARIKARISRSMAFGLVAWLLVVEASVEYWYYSRESHFVPGPEWSIVLPHDNPKYQTLPIDEKTKYLLRFDAGQQGEWSEPGGVKWQAFVFDWLPGRVAGYLAKRHTPEICLPAAGGKFTAGPELTILKIHGIMLPVRAYVFQTDGGQNLYVFHCRWEAGAGDSSYVEKESARFNLIRGVWAGRGKNGQKVFEFISEDFHSLPEAKEALAKELEKVVTVKGSTATSAPGARN